MRTLIVFAVLVASTSCSGDTGTTAPEISVASISVSGVPTAGVLMVGESVGLVAATKDASGAAITGRIITWSSSDATVASVSSVGSVTGIKGGFATITASADGRTGTADFSIRVAVPTPVAGATQATTTSTLAGAVTLTVPPAAVAAGTVLNVAPASPAALPASSLLLANAAFAFGPEGTQFATPITLSLRFDSTKVPIEQRAGLALYLAKNGGWEEVPGSTVSGTTNEVSAPVSHFSTYALLTRPPAASAIIISGNNQTGAPGSFLLEMPAVRVLDAQGRGVVRAPVKWTVTSGGGFIDERTIQTQYTGMDGVVVDGYWRLGPAAGVNTITAVVLSPNPPPPVTFTATGNTAYKLVGGTVTGGVSGAGGVTLSMNGADIGGTTTNSPGTNTIKPGTTTISPGATSFTFPNSVGPLQEYGVTVARQPLSQTCTIVRGKGIIGTANVTNVGVECTNNLTSPLSGTYTATDGPGLRLYITLWPDGTFTSVDRENDPSCGPSNGNGIEYGVYNWDSGTGAFRIVKMTIDTNGPCGASNLSGIPGLKLVKAGNTLTLTAGANVARVLTAVQSTPSTIVGAFGGNVGSDGGFVVFQNDGTYMIAETQMGTGNGGLAGFERGCYTVSGSAITASLSTSCRPDGGPTTDSNGTAGLSDALGIPVPFVITGPNSITAGGQTFIRLLPN